MSERLKSTNSQVSNEEIIEELTQQFGIITNEEKTKPGASSKESLEAAEDDTKAEQPEKLPENETDIDFNEIPLAEDNSDSETDFVDEEALKDEEVGLTDEERDKRKAEAEELKKAGNDAFAVGEYERSILKYTEGLRICPLQYNKQRAILYCNRSAAKIKLKLYDKAVKDCTKAIELDEEYLKAYHRRALSYEQTDKLDESFSDYKKVLELDPSDVEARKAVVRLPPLIEEKNEKLKTEMLGKLKQLGNMVLKPFGLSTDNFQLEQDPETKGYKINFKQ